MDKIRGNSLIETRRKNRVLIKKQIYHCKEATRTLVAENLGLTMATLSTSTNEMINQGLIEEVQSNQSMSMSGVGRKPKFLRFRDEAACTIGVDAGPYATRAVLMDVGGNILAKCDGRAVQNDYDDMLKVISESVNSLLQHANANFEGVCIGMAGIIDSDSGIIIEGGRHLGFEGKNLKSDLEKILGCNVIIDNNARVRARGYSLKKHVSEKTFAYLYVARGIACPLMAQDELLSGYTASAGELGRMAIEWKTSDERLLTLNEISGEVGIISGCKKELSAGNMENLRKRTDGDDDIKIETLMELEKENDPEVVRIFEDACHYLGIALSNVACLINPGTIVVDGYIFENSINREFLEKAYAKRCQECASSISSIKYIDFNGYTGAESAAYCALDSFFLDV